MTKGRLFLIIQSALCILLALLLCAAAIDLYMEGQARKAEHPLESSFTREGVAEKLAPIAPLFFTFVGLTAAGLLLGVKDNGASKPAKGAAVGRNPVAPRAAQPGEAIKKEPESQRRRGVLRTALVLAAIALIIAGIFNGSALDVLYKAANICTECIGLG